MMYTLKKYSLLLMGILAFSPSLLFADLIITINQVDPLAPACILTGSTVTYTINVFNNGPTSVRNILFDDSLISAANKQAGICLISVNDDCRDFCITKRSNGFSALGHDSLDVNDSFTFTVTYGVCTPSIDTLTNLVTVTAVDCRANIIQAQESFTSCVNGCALAVSLSPAINTQVCSNGSIAFVAHVTGACQDPLALDYVWTDQNGNPLTATAPGLLVLTAQDIANLGITAVIVTVTDSFTGCSVTATSAPVSIGQCADLSISKTAVVNQGVVTYTITVTNNGPSVTMPQVRDCFPDCLTVLTVDALGWGFFMNGNCLVATLGGVLLVNESATITVTARIDDCRCDKRVCNTATVQGSVFDPDLSNNSASVTIKTKSKKRC